MTERSRFVNSIHTDLSEKGKYYTITYWRWNHGHQHCKVGEMFASACRVRHVRLEQLAAKR